MIWRPDTTHTLVQTCHWLLCTLQLLSASFLEKVCFLQNLARLQVPYAHRLLSAIDVESLDKGVLLGPRRDTDLNLRVFAGEGGEELLQECTVMRQLAPWPSKETVNRLWRHSHHALRAASPIAVMEVKTFAL